MPVPLDGCLLELSKNHPVLCHHQQRCEPTLPNLFCQLGCPLLDYGRYSASRSMKLLSNMVDIKKLTFHPKLRFLE